ncbi:hypothetical protein ACFV98_34890 [Streptomyces violascens]|uniref:hypothetical protein n=1 Tax=Streptomyces violascens TaxID=67381 RepID=UPI003655D3F8
MTDAANTPSTTRATRVIAIVAFVISVAHIGLWIFTSGPQLMNFVDQRTSTLRRRSWLSQPLPVPPHSGPSSVSAWA